MAEKVEKATAQPAEAAQDVVYMPLQQFADTYALKYGIELMGGFFFEQEQAKKFADTEENWHKAIDEFSKKEVM